MDGFESREVTGNVVGKFVYLRREEREVENAKYIQCNKLRPEETGEMGGKLKGKEEQRVGDVGIKEEVGS